MKRIAFALALLSAGCAIAAPETIVEPTDAGPAPETAYPCGFDGSPMVDECHTLIPNGLPYCAHPDAGITMSPFDDCRPVLSDTAATWWCCPYQ